MTLMARIGDVADIIRGVTYDKQDARQSPTAGYLPLLRATNIQLGRIHFDDLVFVPQDVVSGEQIIRVGDIVLAASSGSLSVVGKAAPVLASWRGTFGAFCAAVRPKIGISSDYLSHFMQTSDYRAQVSSLAAGVNINNLRREQIENIAFPFTGGANQQRIVESIDSYLSRLDAATASLERVQAKLKAYRASVLKAAVEGRLVPTEAELARQEGRDYEPASVLLARILKERRRRWEEAELARMKKAGKPPKDDAWKSKYQDPEAPDTSKLPPLPEGWCWATMAALIADGPQNGLYVPQSRYGDGFPILRIDDFQAVSSRSSHELQRVAIPDSDADHYALRDGDMVINRVNSMTHLGKALAIEGRHRPAVFESNMMRFSLARGVEPRYLWAYLCSSDGKGRLTKNAKWAVNQASINQKDVAACAVPLPPIEEQPRILSELDRLLSAVAATSDSTLRNQLRCQRLRQSILKWAFEGKLVDQDPSDEPAEELLARIRAERAAAPATKTRGRKAKSS